MSKHPISGSLTLSLYTDLDQTDLKANLTDFLQRVFAPHQDQAVYVNIHTDHHTWITDPALHHP